VLSGCCRGVACPLIPMGRRKVGQPDISAKACDFLLLSGCCQGFYRVVSELFTGCQAWLGRELSEIELPEVVVTSCSSFVREVVSVCPGVVPGLSGGYQGVILELSGAPLTSWISL